MVWVTIIIKSHLEISIDFVCWAPSSSASTEFNIAPSIRSFSQYSIVTSASIQSSFTIFCKSAFNFETNTCKLKVYIFHKFVRLSVIGNFYRAYYHAISNEFNQALAILSSSPGFVKIFYQTCYHCLKINWSSRCLKSFVPVLIFSIHLKVVYPPRYASLRALANALKMKACASEMSDFLHSVTAEWFPAVSFSSLTLQEKEEKKIHWTENNHNHSKNRMYISTSHKNSILFHVYRLYVCIV